MKKVLIILVTILLLFMSSGDSFAFEQASGSSATLNSTIATPKEFDDRAMVLRQYLENRNSPLATYAKNFVDSADRHNLDWRLVASIAGLESSYGVHIPANSYNGWGWGYSAGSVKHFESWDVAIEEISRGIRENYLKETPYSDPYVIGPRYAASPTWAVRVTNFMNNIEDFRAENTKSTLSLAL